MRHMLCTATISSLLVAVFCFGALAAEAPYVDDRSEPAAVVRSLYSAINRHEYARAWGYFGETKPASDFEAFVKGYETTGHVDVETGNFSEEGVAGSVYYTIPVAIRAVGTDGSEAVFAGCYTLRQVNARIQEPPFNPIHIDKGALKASTAEFGKALPESCGDGPPPKKKDSALEQAKTEFALAYGGLCAMQPAGDDAPGGPEAYTINTDGNEGTDGEPGKQVRLFRFPCAMAAYNESAVYYVADESGAVRQLQFSVPELDIRYENGDSEGKVEAVNVIGFQTDDQLLNSSFDAETQTITSHAKWRGVGDASSSGTYLFRDGRFSLVQYDVDASYDGAVNPQTVIDYNTPP